MTEKVTIAHIQHNFVDVIEDVRDSSPTDNTFFINVNSSPNEITEHVITVEKLEPFFSCSPDDQFKKLNINKYEATLNGETFRFNTSVKDWTTANSNTSWSAVDVIQTPQMRYLLGDSVGNIKVFDENYDLEREFENIHSSDITSAKFFPSAEVILSASSDMQLKILSVEDGSNPRTFAGHTSTVTGSVIVGRGRNVLSSSKDGTIRLWECGSGSNIHSFTRRENPSDSVNSISLRSESGSNSTMETSDKNLEYETEGKTIFGGHTSGVVTVFDIFSKKQLLQLPSEFMSSCTSVSADPKEFNHVVAGYENGTVAIWDIRYPNSCVSKAIIKDRTPINKLLFQNGMIITSTGCDTSLSMDIAPDSKKINTNIPTFFVSDGADVSDFASFTDQKGIHNLIAVGRFGYCAGYEL
ncbi:similar to Saccharomyces cerevisiae YGL004C RPN14 Proteasome-interacting protein involved in the assembly of the base subcomplex of the 19S proteasome regulatory particle (RP) [Maudiozyma saulgeensis]|uniref:Similar to Saccharomyces cerevisiae YGL004C RPN14 Proteasome-interacting protein involved in the assembly of the base subcomplex of the 19S proteasome regulatory particle (RP) n=1 Tax=Maudiozyma saulgeensis TaxID=1789683 RepID=A0A1X7RAN5_9SACH|nr:similar to Saccharomyces cerevisiae YGL004C RPN14 Proteasome-interacting protein involved in the assembly of the base subcomplex of the 19S proteasome regulatory particle (RP) [Kazachstania saulgeensis]